MRAASHQAMNQDLLDEIILSLDESIKMEQIAIVHNCNVVRYPPPSLQSQTRVMCEYIKVNPGQYVYQHDQTPLPFHGYSHQHEGREWQESWSILRRILPRAFLTKWKGNVSKKDASKQYRIVANAKSTGEPVGAKCEDAQREVKASISALPMVGESVVAFLIVHDPPNLEVYAKLMEAVHDVLSTAAIRVPKEEANAESTEAVGDARHQSVQLAPNEGTTAPRMGAPESVKSKDAAAQIVVEDCARYTAAIKCAVYPTANVSPSAIQFIRSVVFVSPTNVLFKAPVFNVDVKNWKNRMSRTAHPWLDSTV
ncbi:hypothetical protein AeMF1_007192 [Aphanomyces euteiches]|nr:hypothetical protein AeMF1_007192 [Aphanomyces euteiches]KAH9182345.1 hypothetical protein AeNC1_015678 [Aphanomyces euteiches]